MGMRRAVFLLIASLLLWCGSMLLVLDLANASGNQGQVALIGLFLVAIGGSWLWADFFEVTAWFTRKASQRFDDFNPGEVVVERPKNHGNKPRWRARWRFGQLLAKVEREKDKRTSEAALPKLRPPGHS